MEFSVQLYALFVFLEGALLYALEGISWVTLLGAADAFGPSGDSGEGGEGGAEGWMKGPKSAKSTTDVQHG